MKLLLPAAVLMLMVSTGMSLELRRFVASWRGLSPGAWARLLAATFVLPPLLVLALGQLLPVSRAAVAGLYLIAVAPGAPLMMRNVARRGFDLHLAAGYQVWGALLAPVMIPLLVGGAAGLYGREIWIPPGEVLAVVLRQLFLPLLLGMALMHFAPAFSMGARRLLNLAGNLLLIGVIVALLVEMGPALLEVGPWLALAVLVLAAGCLAAGHCLLRGPGLAPQTLAMSNVNRHAGLALLLSGAHGQNTAQALPAIAAYALAAPLVMALYGRWVQHQSIAESKP